MTQVLAFGGAVMDFVNDGVGGWSARPGGSAWNVARALSALGTPTSFIGALGDDPFATQLRAEADEHGVDLRFSQNVRANTALSVIHRTHPAQYAFYAAQAADCQFSRLPPEAWQGVSAVYFGGVTLVRDPARAVFLQCARDASARGVQVVYDPNYRAVHGDAFREIFQDYLPLADVIKLSHEDLAGLLPHLSPHDALTDLRRSRPELTILLTLGEAGARLLTPQLDLHLGAYPVPVVDTVGAGDASIAGLLCASLEPDLTHHDQLAFALACGAAACTRSGAHAPSRREVENLQKERP